MRLNFIPPENKDQNPEKTWGLLHLDEVFVTWKESANASTIDTWR